MGSKSNMKKADFLVSTLVYAFYMFISCVVIMLAEILTVKVVNLFVVTEYYELTVLRAVVYTVGVNAVLGKIAYKEGYRAARYPIPETLVSGVLASVLHALVSLLFHFEAFCAGGVRFITALLHYGKDLTVNTLMDELGVLDFLPVFLVNSLVYVGIMIVLGKLGEYKRLADREDLTEGNNDVAKNQ